MRIEPSQGSYRVGTQIRVCYTVPGPGDVVLTDITPTGARQTIVSGMDDGRGDCIPGTVTEPLGRECIRIDFRNAQGSSSSDVCFDVVAAGTGTSLTAPSPSPSGGRRVTTLTGGTGSTPLGCIPCDGQARFMGPGRLGTALGLGVNNRGEASVAVAQPVGGTLRNLRVRVSASDGGIWSFGVWVNGAPASLSCTINGRTNRGQTTCDSGAATLPIRAGDRISIGVGNPGDPFTQGNFTVEWSLELESAP